MSAKLAGVATPVKPGKPSLYNNVPAGAGNSQGGSILGELESSRPRRMKRGALLAVLLCIGAALAGWQALQGRTGESTLAPTVLLATPAAKKVRSEPDQLTAPVKPLPVAGLPAPAPAAIVQDIPLPVTPPPVAKLPPALMADNPPLTQTLPTGDGQLAKNDVVVPASAGVSATTDRQAALADTPKNAASASAEKPAVRLATKAAVPEKKAVAKTSSGKDGDVELIAALLKRVSDKPQSTVGEAGPKPLSGEGQKRTAPVSQKTGKKTGASRASVAHKPADAIEMELKRCNSLGFIESEMCRLRACTGRWGNHPGCPEFAPVSTDAL